MIAGSTNRNACLYIFVIVSVEKIILSSLKLGSQSRECDKSRGKPRSFRYLFNWTIQKAEAKSFNN